MNINISVAGNWRKSVLVQALAGFIQRMRIPHLGDMNMSRQLAGYVAAIVMTFALAGAVRADDWPQWMGPNRDDRWNETGILQTFPKDGPEILWRVPVAGGYSGPAVVGRKVFVTDFVKETGSAGNNPNQRSEAAGRERVMCFDAVKGKELWTYAYKCEYKISYPAGPRTTPTVHDGKVYTLGAEGNLICIDAEKGTAIWQKDLKLEYKTEAPIWGFCGHPLVDGKKLICLVGGEGSIAVAFDKDTGKELWRWLSARDAGYCPPSIITAGGKRQLLIWHPQAINSLDPETGKSYWSVPLEPNYGMSIIAPRQSGDYLFASGIGGVGAAYKLDREKPGAELAWRGDRNSAVYCANSTPVIEDGVIYASDCDVGCFRAVQLKDGKRLWETFEPTTGNRRGRHGTAFITKNADRYFLFSETGDLIIAKLSAEKYDEVSRAHIIEPTNEAFGRPVVWTHPAYANKCAFVRNDRELICVSLAE